MTLRLGVLAAVSWAVWILATLVADGWIDETSAGHIQLDVLRSALQILFWLGLVFAGGAVLAAVLDHHGEANARRWDPR